MAHWLYITATTSGVYFILIYPETAKNRWLILDECASDDPNNREGKRTDSIPAILGAVLSWCGEDEQVFTAGTHSPLPARDVLRVPGSSSCSCKHTHTDIRLSLFSIKTGSNRFYST